MTWHTCHAVLWYDYIMKGRMISCKMGRHYLFWRLCETNVWCDETWCDWMRLDKIWCFVICRQCRGVCHSAHLILYIAVQSTSLSSLNTSAASRPTSPQLTSSQGLVIWRKTFVISEPCSSVPSTSSLFPYSHQRNITVTWLLRCGDVMWLNAFCSSLGGSNGHFSTLSIR